jgi:hypothetical protein
MQFYSKLFTGGRPMSGEVAELLSELKEQEALLDVTNEYGVY